MSFINKTQKITLKAKKVGLKTCSKAGQVSLKVKGKGETHDRMKETVNASTSEAELESEVRWRE